jgi:spore maturation protein CgeB
MKILVVGDGRSAIHEVAVFNAFKKLGHTVEAFYWGDYYNSQNPFVRFWLRVQNKFIIEPMLSKVNAGLIRAAIEISPDLIFIYRGTHITSRSINNIKQKLPSCIIYGYNNDDPFSTGHPRWLWRHFLKCVPKYDLMFAYRKSNMQEYNLLGAQRVALLMPWFIPEFDRPVTVEEVRRNRFEVIFVGHYECDDRMEYLRQIAESSFVFGLFGPDWSRAPKSDWLRRYQPVLPVRGDLYRQTICSANIVLCFLSKLNRDTYTRRCFEIPAMGAFMLCQYTSDVASLFADGVDAVFFRNPEDMMKKIAYYTNHPKLRAQIAASGMNRVIRDKHDIVSRMRYVLTFTEMKEL